MKGVTKKKFTDTFNDSNSISRVLRSTIGSFQTYLSEVSVFSLDGRIINGVYVQTRIFDKAVKDLWDEILKLDKLNTKYNILGYNSMLFLITEFLDKLHINFLGFANNKNNLPSKISIPNEVNNVTLSYILSNNKPEEIVLPDNVDLCIYSKCYEDIKISNIGHTKRIINKSRDWIKVDNEIEFDRLDLALFLIYKFYGIRTIKFTDNCNTEAVIVNSSSLETLVLNEKVRTLRVNTITNVKLHTKDDVIYNKEYHTSKTIEVFTPLKWLDVRFE